MKHHTASLIKLINLELPVRRVVGVEVGVWGGDNASHLLKRCRKIKQLYLVDNYRPSELLEGSCLQDAEDAAAEALKKTRRDQDRRTLLVQHSVQASRMFPDGFFDFVFIDADHHYEAVVADLRAWWPKVRPGGWFGGHDYRSRLDRKGPHGVSKAVDEFCRRRRLEMLRRPGWIWGVWKP